MGACRFVGGSLDGAMREVPAGVTTAVTLDRGGSRSWYAADGDGETLQFIGFGTRGQAMGKIIRAIAEAAQRDREAIDEALKPRGCRSCGLTFGSAAAWRVHFEGQPGAGCLPPGAFGQLQQNDAGVWCIPGSDAARR